MQVWQSALQFLEMMYENSDNYTTDRFACFNAISFESYKQ